MKAKLDDLLGPGGKASDDVAKKAVDDFHLREPEANWGGQNVAMTAERTGLSEKRIDDILDAGKGNRPDPAIYMPAGAIGRHLDVFRSEGAVRITTNADIAKFGSIGQAEGGFVIAKSELDDLIVRTNGDKKLMKMRWALSGVD